MKKYLLLLISVIALMLFAGCLSSTNESGISTNTDSPENAVHDLHNVHFHLVDQNNTPIEHAFIIANFNSTEYPNESISLNELKSFTDPNGNLTFVMKSSIEYNITVSNLFDHVSRSETIHPTDVDYIWHITPFPTPSPTPTWTNTFENINDNNWFLQVAKSVCSFIPTVNTALNC